MAFTQLYTSVPLSLHAAGTAINSPRTSPALSISARLGSTASTLSISRISPRRKSACKATSLSIRCEQSTKEGNGLGVWLGRAAMIGFASAISVEIATGKGLLQNFGLTSPVPTAALGVTALVGVLTAIFIFQSSSKN